MTATHESQSGAIRGRVVAVTADKREPIPGALVRLSGAILRGQVFEAVSDADGNYSFGGLNAGDYLITVDLNGFSRFEKNVILQIDATIEFAIHLTPKTITETVTVKADETEAAKTESTIAGHIGTNTLRNAPLVNEKFQDALPLLPGVVRAPDGSLAIKGARASQSSVIVSSLNATDPVTGASAIDLPIEAVESVQVFSSPYAAEYGRFTGGLTSIETRSGTNEWRYLATNFLARPRIREGKIYGIQGWTPRIAVGGPIRKDTLFFFQSLEYRFVRTEVPSLPPGARDSRLESFDSFTRIDYNINTRNRLAVSFSVFPQKLDFFTLNTFNPIETTANLHQRGWFFAVNEQATFANGALLQSSFSAKQFDADIYGNGSGEYRISPDQNFGGYFDEQRRESRRFELLEVFNAAPFQASGQHLLKVGVNYSFTDMNGTNESRPVRVIRANLTNSQLIEFVGGGRLDRDNSEFSTFVQDKWNPSRRITIDTGLRYDRDTIGRRNNFAPRLGFAILLTSDEKTVARGGFGLFYDRIPLGIGLFNQYQ